MYKKLTKNKYVTHKQTTTTELQAPNLGQEHTYIQCFLDTSGPLFN